ncbi:MAG: nickel-responsive transcriptional regulator NikR [Candidatus Methanomethylicia archaeon]|nr:nickel-responsive transcriptional regulator NikR [Candidatus Methanomethylicia archaeon]
MPMTVKEHVERFSISAPPQLLMEFDEVVKALKQDRSKAVQQAMRLYLSEYKWSQPEKRIAGAIVLIYDHEVHDAEEGLTDLQHGYRQIINSVLHIHIDDNNCLEIIAVNGEGQLIKELIDRLMSIRGISQIKHTIIGI